eukprot:jgi/Botrbrau1/17217/Bobra.0401s0003.1
MIRTLVKVLTGRFGQVKSKWCCIWTILGTYCYLSVRSRLRVVLRTSFALIESLMPFEG